MALLPYLDQSALYDQINPNAPWDAPSLATIRDTSVPTYFCPSLEIPGTNSTYLGMVGNRLVLQANASRRIGDIPDPHDATILVLEAAPEHAVPWLAPQDATSRELLTLDGKTPFAHQPGTHTLYLDGSVGFISHETLPENPESLAIIDNDAAASNAAADDVPAAATDTQGAAAGE